MPLRPDLPNGLNLTRRPTTPVKLPKMNFPMVGGVAESGFNHHLPPGAVEGTMPMPDQDQSMMQMNQEQAACAAEPAPAPRASAKVIVYGRSGCAASIDAIQDLIERQVSFTYYDVGRDASAMAHLQAICAGQPVVPVIIYVGYGGT